MRWVEDVWGTRISIEVPAGIPPQVRDELRDWFDRVDEMFSTWRPDSEVMRLATGELDPAGASPAVREVLAACDQLLVDTRGAFDIHVGAHPDAAPAPGRAPIDPSGFVKGWALDRAGEMLAAWGVREFWISAGGDALVRSAAPVGGRWRIGVQHPWQHDKVAAVLGIDCGAIATSGRYERGDHILDPRTGHPATGLMSVTVVGATLGLVDAYATAAVAMGRDGMAWLAELPDIEAMGITDDGRVISTVGFRPLEVAI